VERFEAALKQERDCRTQKTTEQGSYREAKLSAIDAARSNLENEALINHIKAVGIPLAGPHGPSTGNSTNVSSVRQRLEELKLEKELLVSPSKIDDSSPLHRDIAEVRGELDMKKAQAR